MNKIRLKARAKINITLDIIARRENGYHDVEMIMQTINLYDRLILSKRQDSKIIIKTNLPYLPTDERNLVYKIIQYFMETYQVTTGISVDLYKMIPVAAGLAGGSSDAAQTIVGLNKLYELNLSLEEMLEIGGKFGSDIPYCIIQGTALATGLGDELTTLPPFPKMYVVILKPRFSMSTATVYQNFDLKNVTGITKTQEMVKAIENQDKSYICNNLYNILETVTTTLHPMIIQMKEKLLSLGASGSLMSGSGPTVYGLFEDEGLAKEAVKRFKKEKKMQFVYLTSIYNPTEK